DGALCGRGRWGNDPPARSPSRQGLTRCVAHLAVGRGGRGRRWPSRCWIGRHRALVRFPAVPARIRWFRTVSVPHPPVYRDDRWPARGWLEYCAGGCGFWGSVDAPWQLSLPGNAGGATLTDVPLADRSPDAVRHCAWVRRQTALVPCGHRWRQTVVASQVGGSVGAAP